MMPCLAALGQVMHTPSLPLPNWDQQSDITPVVSGAFVIEDIAITAITMLFRSALGASCIATNLWACLRSCTRIARLEPRSSRRRRSIRTWHSGLLHRLC